MFRENWEEALPSDTPTLDVKFTPDQIDDLIKHLYRLEKHYGIVVTAITRGDVEEAWKNEFLAGDKEAPTFTDELWDKFQDTYEWRKGFAEVMWDAVHQLMVGAMYDFVLEQETSEESL